MNVEIKALLDAKLEGAGGCGWDYYELLRGEKTIYQEEVGEHRWWIDVFKVVKIDDRLIGFVDWRTTGDGSDGWEFDEESICEVEPYEVTETRYREKQ